MRLANNRREGFALAVAIGAIVIIGALIAGVFFASTQEFRVGRNTLQQMRARTAAEYGLRALFDTTRSTGRWNPAWNNSSTMGLQGVVAFNSGGAWDTVRVTKLNRVNFLLVSEALAGSQRGAQARSRLGTLVTLRIPSINVRGALTSRTSVTVGGSSDISGNDTTLAGWDCPPPDTALPGISVPDPTQVKTPGCTDLSCIHGDPQIQKDTVAGKDSTYFQFGDLSWTELTSLAEKVIPAGVSVSPDPSTNPDGSCNMTPLANWGDPIRQTADSVCKDYYPIIYAQGDLKLQQGVGQGILLVEGNLTVTGNFSFYGPVIVKGTLSTSGTGNHFNGGLMAADVTIGKDSTSSVLGNAVIHYSSCAITKAVAGSAQPVVGGKRNWMELF